MTLTETEKRAALERRLTDPAIARSDRSVALLSYLGDAALEGRDLTVYAIAFDVFERDADFDPSSDPIVRVAMTRLRKALADYAVRHGSEDPVDVTLPQRSYELRFAPSAAATDPASFRPRKKRNGLALAMMAFAVVGCAAVALSLWMRPDGASPRTAFERPVVAVMPFSNLTTDETYDFLAEGIQHQIASDLWRFNTMRVVTVFDPNEVRRDQGGAVLAAENEKLDYFLFGSVIFDGTVISVAMTLRQADSDIVLWRNVMVRRIDSDKYSDMLQDVSRMVSAEIGPARGAVSQDVLSQLGNELGLGEDTTAVDVEDYLCLLRYSAWEAGGSNSGGGRALKACLDDMLLREPDNASALAAEAWIMALSTDPTHEFHEPGDVEDRKAKALEMALSATSKAPGSDFVQLHLGLVQWVNGMEAAAGESFRRAASLNPAAPQPQALIGLYGCLRRDCGDYMEEARKAIALSVNPAPWYYAAPTIEALMDGDYDTALRYAKKLRDSGDPIDCSFLVPAAVLAGRPDEAETCREDLATVRDLTGGDALGWRPWIRRDDLIELLDRGIAGSGL